MRKIAAAAAAASGAAALVAGLTSPAYAASWTAAPGGNINGASVGQTQLKDLTTGVILRCNSSAASGNVHSDADGIGLGAITNISFTTCTVGPFSFNVTAVGVPWSIDAISYNAGTGVTTGNITGIKANLTGAGCSAKVGGAGGAATSGQVTSGTFTNSTDRLATNPVAPGGTLHIWNVVGCGGLIGNGHAAQFIATYQINPGQTITSP